MKKLIYKIIFALEEVIKVFMKIKENGENIYKTLNTWLRSCRSILAFMKKEIKDTQRETGRKMLNSIFMNNKEPSHILKGRTVFFITFAENFIIKIDWNPILYHSHASSVINYGNFLVPFFFSIFPAPTSFSFFYWFAPYDSLIENNKTLTAPLHLMNSF